MKIVAFCYIRCIELIEVLCFLRSIPLFIIIILPNAIPIRYCTSLLFFPLNICYCFTLHPFSFPALVAFFTLNFLHRCVNIGPLQILIWNIIARLSFFKRNSFERWMCQFVGFGTFFCVVNKKNCFWKKIMFRSF